MTEYWLFEAINDDGDNEIGGLFPTREAAETGYDEWRNEMIQTTVDEAQGEYTRAELIEEFDSFWHKPIYFTLTVHPRE